MLLYAQHPDEYVEATAMIASYHMLLKGCGGSVRRALQTISSRPFASTVKPSSSHEYFPGVEKIEYEGPHTDNPFAFRWYNPSEVIKGKTMEEWCRFSVCYWHTFTATGQDPFGLPTQMRPWLTQSATSPMEMAFNKADAAFEFIQKLGVKYYTFHDRDVAPEANSIEETQVQLDSMKRYLKEKQDETGIKLLWGTSNLFSHPKYMNGAMTSPDFDTFCHAAAQVRHAMQVTHELGGENFVFWGGREGYQTILNTNLSQELDQLASFMKLVVNHKKRIGATYQLLIEPKPREPTKHQYDYDAATVYGFLKRHHLDNEFKVNIEPNHTTLAGHDYEHDILLAKEMGILGSIDVNTGDPLVGWDTDQFLMDPAKATLVMRAIVELGGLQPGGLNFDAKVRRESTDLNDLFIGHIGSIDCFARGLRNAVELMEDNQFNELLEQRYGSWKAIPLAQKVLTNSEGCSLEELEAYAKKTPLTQQHSAKQELFELLYRRALDQ